MAYTLQRQGVGIESIPESGVDHMKTNKVVTCLTSLSFAIVFFTSSFATAQQTEAEQHDRIANEEQLERARAAMEECANAPNNVGQGAEENVRPGNPNAPADIQGSRNQQNPGSERSDVVTAQIPAPMKMLVSRIRGRLTCTPILIRVFKPGITACVSVGSIKSRYALETNG
jgi:hypothetical protein